MLFLDLFSYEEKTGYFGVFFQSARVEMVLKCVVLSLWTMKLSPLLFASFRSEVHHPNYTISLDFAHVLGSK